VRWTRLDWGKKKKKIIVPRHQTGNPISIVQEENSDLVDVGGGGHEGSPDKLVETID
jgi:hypothetical protein